MNGSGGACRRMPGRLGACVAALLATCLWGCLSVAGRGSEVENPEVYGVMVDGSGEAVVGARVLAFPAAPEAAMPADPLDSAVTGMGGRYALSALPEGEYNLVGDYQDGRLVVLIPEVRFEPGLDLDLGKDTLLAPGGIQGRVLEGAVGRTGVMAYIPGTSYLSLTGADGAFLLPSVPKGVYRLHYQAAGLQAEPDTGVIVEAGRITRLPDKMLDYDTAAPPPAPARVEAAYDNLQGVVRLRWDPVRLRDLLGYRVYREAGPLSLPEAVSGIVTDTVFQDTVRNLVAGGQTSEVGYRVRTVDRQRNEGTGFSQAVRVAIAPPSLVPTGLSLRLVDAKLSGKAGVGRPARLRLEWSNPTRRVRRLEWFSDSVLVRTVEPETAEGTDSLETIFSEPGFHRVSVQSTDEAGVAWMAAVDIEVIVDAPYVWAGPEIIEASIGDSVHLRPHAFDDLGHVMRWEWEIGAGNGFREVPLGRLAFRAPDTPMDALRCIVRATDDDGNVGLDSLVVRVLADPPIARADAWPLEAFLEDTLALSADSSRDGFGRIVSWEWDIGGRGVFVPSPDGTLRVHGAMASAGVLPCVLRVTDDDGQADTAEVAVTFRDPDRWALWSQDSSAPETQLVDAWIHDEQLVVLGHRTNGVERAPVFARTADMRSWESVPSSGLPGLWDVRAVVHAGRVWLLHRDVQGINHSGNGVEWSLLSPRELEGLQGRILIAHEGSLWMSGLRDQPSAGRVEFWRSPDGTAWSRVTDSASFGIGSIRTGLSWKGRIWAIVDREFNSGSELWSSGDGRNWRLEDGGTLRDLRWAADLVVHLGRLWVVSVNEARHTEDGTRWTEVPLQASDLTSDHSMRPFSYGGRLWMVTGTLSGRGPFFQVWRAPF